MGSNIAAWRDETAEERRRQTPGRCGAALERVRSRRYIFRRRHRRGERMSKSTALWIAVAAAAAVGTVTAGAIAQQALSGAQKLMVVPASRLPGKVHVLPATLETTQ